MDSHLSSQSDKDEFASPLLISEEGHEAHRGTSTEDSSTNDDSFDRSFSINPFSSPMKNLLSEKVITSG